MHVYGVNGPLDLTHWATKAKIKKRLKATHLKNEMKVDDKTNLFLQRFEHQSEDFQAFVDQRTNLYCVLFIFFQPDWNCLVLP